jgi:hypothetical protein
MTLRKKVGLVFGAALLAAVSAYAAPVQYFSAASTYAAKRDGATAIHADGWNVFKAIGDRADSSSMVSSLPAAPVGTAYGSSAIASAQLEGGLLKTGTLATSAMVPASVWDPVLNVYAQASAIIGDSFTRETSGPVSFSFAVDGTISATKNFGLEEYTGSRVTSRVDMLVMIMDASNFNAYYNWLASGTQCCSWSTLAFGSAAVSGGANVNNAIIDESLTIQFSDLPSEFSAVVWMLTSSGADTFAGYDVGFNPLFNQSAEAGANFLNTAHASVRSLDGAEIRSASALFPGSSNAPTVSVSEPGSFALAFAALGLAVSWRRPRLTDRSLEG